MVPRPASFYDVIDMFCTHKRLLIWWLQSCVLSACHRRHALLACTSRPCSFALHRLRFTSLHFLFRLPCLSPRSRCFRGSRCILSRSSSPLFFRWFVRLVCGGKLDDLISGWIQGKRRCIAVKQLTHRREMEVRIASKLVITERYDVHLANSDRKREVERTVFAPERQKPWENGTVDAAELRR